jgi:GT2 family glycosyltransferase
VVERLGGIDGRYAHAYADSEFGLRCSRAGVPVLLAGEPVGTCPANAGARPWADRSRSRRERVRALTGRKGLPPADHWRYLAADAGLPRAVVYFVASYGRALARALG